MTTPRLHGTPLSHFTRKIRILLHELGVAFDFVRAPGVLDMSGSSYGHNPLLRVPAFVDGDVTIFDSDHIAHYLVRTYDSADRFGVRSERTDDLNVLAVVNGIMANEVTLILARRGGLAEAEKVAYFRKLEAAIDGGLAWLEARTRGDDADFDYRDVALVCMWQHLEHYRLVPQLDAYRRIAARVARFADRPSVAGTAPGASLAEATAAGWTPS